MVFFERFECTHFRNGLEMLFSIFFVQNDEGASSLPFVYIENCHGEIPHFVKDSEEDQASLDPADQTPQTI